MSRKTSKYYYFTDGVFASTYPCTIKTTFLGKEVEFKNSEQYFMFMKALVFSDYAIAERVLREGSNATTARELGRMVKNFDATRWERIKYKVMFDANYEKFNQNSSLKQELLKKDLINLHFAFGLAQDTTWGIGCSYEYAKDDNSNWRGSNLLGKVLDDVRSVLIHGGNMINF